VTSDGHGGTLITDPPVASSSDTADSKGAKTWSGGITDLVSGAMQIAERIEPFLADEPWISSGWRSAWDRDGGSNNIGSGWLSEPYISGGVRMDSNNHTPSSLPVLGSGLAWDDKVLETAISGMGFGCYGDVAGGGTVVSGGFDRAQHQAINGGTPEVAAGGTFFAGGGALHLDALSRNQIDLRSLAFSPSSNTISGTQETVGANANGMPRIDEARHLSNLTLLGQYSVANFNASADGHGGVLITDPPSSSSVVQTALVAHQ
jgi:hypothetical protein